MMRIQSLFVLAIAVVSSFRFDNVDAITAGTKEQYLVRGLADIEPAFSTFNGTMYAGLIPTTLYSTTDSSSSSTNTNDTGSQLMFWLFEPTVIPNDDTLVIWMNGGPGCSSLSGCLFEHGPVTIPLHEAGFYGTQNDPKTLQSNPWAWTQATRMLYVEQPVGVGFGVSKADPSNEYEVGSDFYIFLQNFYTLFDNLRSKKLYLFGESYAGMYVPSIAYAIHKQNINTTNALPDINLNGIGIGNGWMDVMIQGPAVIDYLWWHGMIDMYTAKELHQSWENCIGGAPMHAPFHEFSTPDECGVGNVALLSAGDGAVSFGSPNVYDITTFDQYVTIAGDDGAISKFYNNPKVQDALNVAPHRKWKSCTGQDHGRALLQQDRPLSMLPFLSTLLDDAQIDVLVYNGDRDLLANQPGSEITLNKLEWSGSKGWSDVDVFNRSLWIDSPNSVGGYIKSYKNLHLLSVYNSGHMVPYNRPVAALDLVNRFISGKSFHDAPLPTHKARIYERAKLVTDNTVDEELDTAGTGTSSYGHPLFLYLLGPTLLLVGICIGITISRHNHRKYEGYDEIQSNVPIHLTT